MEQVVTTVKQCLEGPVNEGVTQEFTEEAALAQQQVEAARAKLEAFKAELPTLTCDLGQVTGECWSPVGN
jgi:hypothetical protein